MSFDLDNAAGDTFNANNGGWSYLLDDLALQHGWEPEGTTCLNYEEWDGTYMLNDGQVVSAADATAIADAIDRAIAAGAARDYPDLARRFAAFCRRGSFTIR